MSGRGLQSSAAPWRRWLPLLGAACAGAAVAVGVVLLVLRRQRKVLLQRSGTDPLTGLANRNRLDEQLGIALERAAVSGRHTGVLFCDVDGFKEINDRYGHAVGDIVLTALALRLSRTVRATDTVARFGGDEFVVVCPDLTDASEVESIRHRVLAALDEPFTIGSTPHVLSLSIGTATATGSRATPAELVATADEAMFATRRVTSVESDRTSDR